MRCSKAVCKESKQKEERFFAACWRATSEPLGGLVGRLREILGRLRCLRGASWSLLGRLGSTLGVPWGALGRFLGTLGCYLGTLSCSLGALGCSLGNAGAFLADSWGSCGASGGSWGLIGATSEPLGDLVGCLSDLVGRLGCLRGASGDLLGRCARTSTVASAEFREKNMLIIASLPAISSKRGGEGCSLEASARAKTCKNTSVRTCARARERRARAGFSLKELAHNRLLTGDLIEK